MLAEKESSIPKTYSTRRGPLLLYSQARNQATGDQHVHNISRAKILLIRDINILYIESLICHLQYLVSLEASCQSQPSVKKKKVMQRYPQQTNQSRPVRELRSAFLSNRNYQVGGKSRLTSEFNILQVQYFSFSLIPLNLINPTFFIIIIICIQTLPPSTPHKKKTVLLFLSS